MTVERFSAQNFRCLCSVEFEPEPAYNVIFGANASGKTSLLEALAYLGRGRSFRGASTVDLIHHGEREFVLFGELRQDGRLATVGVGNGPGGLEIRMDGNTIGGAAALAEALPLQIVDSEVHDLVSGGPEQRRRYVDWLAFHVEHDYLSTWRRFRRVLKQRNAALKAGTGRASLAAWNAEFAELGTRVDEARRQALAIAAGSLRAQARGLLGEGIRFEYQGGWNAEKGLDEALEVGFERDIAQGTTQQGPHRADLRLIHDNRQARRIVSRGQQKLLACAMIFAATETAQSKLHRPLLLLLDDPAAELDGSSLQRLLEHVAALGSQVIATSLDPEALRFPREPAVFHVEQGRLARRA